MDARQIIKIVVNHEREQVLTSLFVVLFRKDLLALRRLVEGCLVSVLYNCIVLCESRWIGVRQGFRRMTGFEKVLVIGSARQREVYITRDAHGKLTCLVIWHENRDLTSCGRRS